MEDRFAVDAWKAHVHDAPDAPLGVAVQTGVGDRLREPGAQYRAQSRALSPMLRQTLGGALRGHPESDHRRQVLRARAARSLLVAAVDERHQAHAPAHIERRRPERPAELVAGQREQVHAERGNVHRQLADGLHRVGMAARPGRVRQLGDLRHRLDHPGLVVHHLDRDERHVGAHLRA